MDPYYAISSPLSSPTAEVVANTLRVLCSVSWNTCYIAMVYSSFRDKTYSNAIIPLCNNLGWEIVYGIFYCPNLFFMRVQNFGWFFLNLGVMYAAINFSSNEWRHAPLVERNLTHIFAVGIIGLTAGHFALAAQLGPHIAFIWSAKGCQLVLSVGSLSQLLSRGSTRGGSYTIWYMVSQYTSWNIQVSLTFIGFRGIWVRALSTLW